MRYGPVTNNVYGALFYHKGVRVNVFLNNKGCWWATRSTQAYIEKEAKYDSFEATVSKLLALRGAGAAVASQLPLIRDTFQQQAATWFAAVEQLLVLTRQEGWKLSLNSHTGVISYAQRPTSASNTLYEVALCGNDNVITWYGRRLALRIEAPDDNSTVWISASSLPVLFMALATQEIECQELARQRIDKLSSLVGTLGKRWKDTLAFSEHLAQEIKDLAAPLVQVGDTSAGLVQYFSQKAQDES
jgi:hypothetical protein